MHGTAGDAFVKAKEAFTALDAEVREGQERLKEDKEKVIADLQNLTEDANGSSLFYSNHLVDDP